MYHIIDECIIITNCLITISNYIPNSFQNQIMPPPMSKLDRIYQHLVYIAFVIYFNYFDFVAKIDMLITISCCFQCHNLKIKQKEPTRWRPGKYWRCDGDLIFFETVNLNLFLYLNSNCPTPIFPTSFFKYKPWQLFFM